MKIKWYYWLIGSAVVFGIAFMISRHLKIATLTQPDMMNKFDCFSQKATSLCSSCIGAFGTPHGPTFDQCKACLASHGINIDTSLDQGFAQIGC